MTATEETLGGFIEQAAARSWAANKLPYLLSSLAPDFKNEGHDYKQVIGDERLKSAAKRLSGLYSFMVVEHPTQRAKVGVIPKGESFDFVDEKAAHRAVGSVSSHSPGSASQRQKASLEFLEALGKLPPDLLDGITVSTKVLVKLLGSR
jgi:hypothetical protein